MDNEHYLQYRTVESDKYYWENKNIINHSVLILIVVNIFSNNKTNIIYVTNN